MATRKSARSNKSTTPKSGRVTSNGLSDYEVEVGERDRPPQEEDPWPIEGQPDPRTDCDCPPPQATPGTGPSRPRPPEGGPKGDDCCRQILAALRCIPGIDETCLHLRKPKTPPKVKIANLCGV